MKVPCTQIADEILASLAKTTANQTLHIILATDDTGAATYTQLKQRKATEHEIPVVIDRFGPDVTAAELTKHVQQISQTHPTMVQLPLYPHLQTDRRQILDAIDPTHDVDGLTTASLGKAVSLAGAVYPSLRGFLPATVTAIWEVLEWISQQTQLPINHLETSSSTSTTAGSNDLLSGKQVVIVNNSALIGLPLSATLSQSGATVTICHEFTRELDQHLRAADIVISATGVVGLIKPAMLKPGVIAIDVGSVRTDSGVKGDFVQDEEFLQKVSFFTPVPGGIGPLTIACLLRNVAKSS